MRILMINSVCGLKSTGRICTDLALQLEEEGNEVKIAYGRETVPEQFERFAVRIGSETDVKLHGAVSKLFDAHGLASRAATRRFLEWADSYNPELLWLHNIHGYYINYELLFDWIKSRENMEVRWTLHDCWAFTGHCSYFTLAGCEQWKSGCRHCPQPGKYPARLLIDNCRVNYRKKKKAFCGVKNMTLITPSKWLDGIVSQSFLKDYPTEVYYNTVDTDVFKPTESDFRKKHNLEDKKIILGVAVPWDERKGLPDFVKLNSMLTPEYRIVLVGLAENQIKELPDGILGLPKTDSADELAEIYSAADVFVNPTYEDNFPTTNLEAAACGTPVITYDTGGSPESAEPENTFACGDVAGVWERIRELLV